MQNSFKFKNSFGNALVFFVMLTAILALATTTDAHAKRKSKSKRIKIEAQSGSMESTKDRDKRLKRECKGAVNAGMCAGFTR